jgi:hypothetical protein
MIGRRDCIRSSEAEDVRLGSSILLIEAGHVLLPEEAPWKAVYLKEIAAFPRGKYDDQVDSTAQFLAWFRDRGTPLPEVGRNVSIRENHFPFAPDQFPFPEPREFVRMSLQNRRFS